MMSRVVAVGIHLVPNLPEEDFVASAIGNLAAFALERKRKEKLQWQVLRVEESQGKHYYRLVIRHPERVLDLGIRRDLARILDGLSSRGSEILRADYEAAKAQGMRTVEIRSVAADVDYWEDEFWGWIGLGQGWNSR
jgi:hypothetical protein